MNERQDAVAGYIRNGYAPIPTPKESKSPYLDDWVNTRLTLADVARFWNNGQNVGLLTGDPSGWAVDVDLDVSEARELGGRFLPPTRTSGRKSSPHSHWWYLSEEAESKRYKDTDGKMIVELRSTGCQTLVAPSIHPSGEKYVWHDESGLEMEQVDAQELDRRVRELATASLIARHLPPHRSEGGGGRHDYALPIAGYLLRRLDRELVRDILFAAWDAKGWPGKREEREAKRDLEGIVRDTAEKIQKGEPVVGGPTLEETIPGMVKLLSKWWGWDRGEDDEREELSFNPEPWPTLDDAALYGLPGEIVEAIDPHTEADKVAVLANLLTSYGNIIGPNAYFQVGADKHHLKLNVALTGETSKGRKGMSWGHVKDLMHAVDPTWEEDRVLNGLSSGEGLINAVRDKVVRVNKDGDVEVVDEGVSDKRLHIVEGELASPLRTMTRDGNTLSPTIRSAWDGGKLCTLTRNSPLKSTGSHISIVGHITKGELTRLLSETDAQNGFANRFLWIVVRRSKKLPFGGEWHKVDVAPLVKKLRSAIEFGKNAGRITWGESAKERWSEIYGSLSEGKPGLFGAVTGRAEAQVVRLACIYAVMDRSRTIELPHLEAALAVWHYAEQSARYIFGDATGDAIADRIDGELRVAPNGLSRNEIRDLFNRNVSSAEIGNALSLLKNLGRARCEKKSPSGKGRPQERWYSK